MSTQTKRDFDEFLEQAKGLGLVKNNLGKRGLNKADLAGYEERMFAWGYMFQEAPSDLVPLLIQQLREVKPAETAKVVCDTLNLLYEPHLLVKGNNWWREFRYVPDGHKVWHT